MAVSEEECQHRMKIHTAAMQFTIVASVMFERHPRSLFLVETWNTVVGMISARIIDNRACDLCPAPSVDGCSTWGSGKGELSGSRL